MLAHLEVMVLDAQATGPSPRQGHLLELGWCRTRAVEPGTATVRSHLMAIPPDVVVPPRVVALTGIGEADLVAGRVPGLVWNELVGQVAPAPLLTVIHFARFEEPFLRALHQESQPGVGFPLTLRCTHDIARRLLPGLPRRTLRALAGYFGHHTGRLRRATDHVHATVAIWRELVSLLREVHGITSLRELDEWLGAPAPPRAVRRIYPMSRERRLGLPDGPGIYRLLGAGGQTLYVGKAACLRQRVNSYFRKQSGHSEATLELLTRVKDVAVVSTGSALEAALAEVEAIRRDQPPYNRALVPTGRPLCFFAADLQSRSPRSDRYHRFGPIADPRPVHAIGSLAGLLATGVAIPAEAARAAALDVSVENGPAEDCFLAGLGELCARHTLRPDAGVRDLLGLGARLWRAWTEGRQEDEEAVADPEPPRPRGWTPERVARTLEQVIARGAHEVRRGRWIAWLSDARVSWRTRSGRVVAIVIEAGAVERHGSAPVSPGRPFAERQADIDEGAYARLRVLTGELRRLLGEDRLDGVTLCPGRTLGAAGVARALRLV